MSNESRPDVSQAHVADFDVIRGVAIMLVMIFHTVPHRVRGGFIGVDIFFALSGFLITRSMNIEVCRSGQNVNLSKFYFRRLIRLAPALILLVALKGAYDLFQSYEIRTGWQEYLYALIYVSNWVRALEVYPMDHLGHTWSLSVEEQFYLIWPLVFFWFLRKSTFQAQVPILRNLLIGLILMVTINRVGLTYNGFSINRLYNGFDTRVDGLLIGSLLGLHFNSQRLALLLHSVGQRKLRVLIWLTFLTILGLALRSDFESHKMYYWGFSLVSVLTVGLLAMVNDINVSNTKSVFGKSSLPFSYIGRISYGLYLFHFPITRILAVQFGYSGFRLAFLVMLTSLLLASISYHFLELRFLALKRRL
jgi:peptidoglycan/LPS O-acetylase OafA/YrhL